MIVLDAGIIVAALDAADAHHDASVRALRAALARGERLLLPASGFAECLVWPLRVSATAAQDAEAFIDALPAVVVPADRVICRTAASLRAEHGRTVRLPDALVIATAIESRADGILTTDQGWPSTAIPVQVIGATS